MRKIKNVYSGSKSEFKQLQAKAKVNSNVPNMNAKKDTICKNEKNQKRLYKGVFETQVYLGLVYSTMFLPANSSEFQRIKKYVDIQTSTLHYYYIIYISNSMIQV